MSTRCQIEFKVVWKPKKGKRIVERRTVYRHSDGYPDGECGVIEDLKKFLKWNNGRNTDVEYMTANFIYWSKRWIEERYFKPKFILNDKDIKKKWYDNLSTNCSNLHIGYGVCENDEFHGDIEYFYEVVVKINESNLYDSKHYISVIPYKVNRTNWNEPTAWKHLKKLKPVNLAF